VCSRRLALLAALAALAPLAAAHADPSETVYDPLTLDLHGWLTAEGGIAASPPAEGGVYFPSYTPADPPSHLDFSMKAPSRFAPATGLDVRVHLVADKPVVAQDSGGSSFTLTLLADGVAVKGASRTLSLGQAALAPGASADLATTLPAAGVTFDKGATLTLRVAPLAPALADASLKVAVGASANSHADFLAAKLPGVQDLGLDEPPGVTLFLLSESTFQPREPDAALVTLSVSQNQTVALSKVASAPVTYVVLRGDHSVAEGRAFHEFPDADARNAAAHVWRVGTQRVRVHPGVGVAVRVNVTAGSVVDVVCESVCPAGGWKTSLPPLAATVTQGGVASDPADVLIPPPRNTAGIPVSGDAPPEEKKAPGPALPLVAGAAGLTLILARRR